MCLDICVPFRNTYLFNRLDSTMQQRATSIAKLFPAKRSDQAEQLEGGRATQESSRYYKGIFQLSLFSVFTFGLEKYVRNSTYRSVYFYPLYIHFLRRKNKQQTAHLSCFFKLDV